GRPARRSQDRQLRSSARRRAGSGRRPASTASMSGPPARSAVERGFPAVARCPAIACRTDAVLCPTGGTRLAPRRVRLTRQFDIPSAILAVSKMNSVNGLAVLAVLLAVVLIWTVVKYNEFIAARNRFHNAFAQIDVQLKRRYDLVPNLVKATRAYLAHERETLEAVVRARQQAVAAHLAAQKQPGDADTLAAIEMAEAALAGPLGRLFALVESYPEMQADQTVARLVEELSSTENRI